MAANRWDGLAPSSASTQSYLNQRQYDTAVRGNVFAPGQSALVRSSLIESRVNTIDPSFYDCIYGVANSATTVVERCYKDIGCCQFGCCPNKFWHNRYGWAVALLVIFCILVIIAVVVSLAIWLVNRAKDKRQKRQVLEETYSQHPTPQPTPLYHEPAEQYSFEPPHNNGYRY